MYKSIYLSNRCCVFYWNLIFLAKDFGLSVEYTPLHGDDLIFINSDFVDPELFNEEEKSLSQHMIRYWTTFAKVGMPSYGDDASPVWYPYNMEEKVKKYKFNKSIISLNHNYMLSLILKLLKVCFIIMCIFIINLEYSSYNLWLDKFKMLFFNSSFH